MIRVLLPNIVLQCDCIACLEDLRSMGHMLLIYTMVIEDGRQWNEVGKQGN